MNDSAAVAYGDPFNMPYWEAAKRQQLMMQHCDDCDSYQYYGRPFCLTCDSTNVDWKPVSGKGRVYSMTRVHMSFDTQRDTPFVVALVDLDEGPRILTNITDDDVVIGDCVTVHWQARENAPPLAVFKYDDESA